MSCKQNILYAYAVHNHDYGINLLMIYTQCEVAPTHRRLLHRKKSRDSQLFD